MLHATCTAMKYRAVLCSHSVVEWVHNLGICTWLCPNVISRPSVVLPSILHDMKVQGTVAQLHPDAVPAPSPSGDAETARGDGVEDE